MIAYGIKFQMTPLLFTTPEKQEHRGSPVRLETQLPEVIRQPSLQQRSIYFNHGREILYHASDVTGAPQNGEPLGLEIQGIMKLFWRHGSDTLYLQPCRFSTPGSETIRFWLLHLLIPLWMSFEDKARFFHAAAVDLGPKRLHLLGPYNSGKSTLCTELIRQADARLVTDDILAIYPDGFHSASGHPWRLSDREETFLPASESYSGLLRPARCFYLLDRSDEDAIIIEPVTGIAKAQAILEHGMLFTPDFLREQRRRQLLARLDSIRLYRIQRPWGKEHLEATVEALLTHLDMRGEMQ